MRNIEIGHPIGFCLGVRRALRLALKIKGEKLFSWGELIHNPHINKRLEKIGIKFINREEDLEEGGVLILRAHGVKEEIIRKAEEKGMKIIDTICPKVKYLQNIAAYLKKEGYYILIVGDKEHPEIEVIKDNLKENYSVVENKDEDFSKLVKFEKIGVVAQTTQSEVDFYNIVSILLSLRISELRIYNTICPEVIERQNNCKYLAEKNDAMIIVGGKNSANTKRLFSIAKSICYNTYHIEDKEELDSKELYSFKSIGITGGTSTPLWVINEIYKSIKLI